MIINVIFMSSHDLKYTKIISTSQEDVQLKVDALIAEQPLVGFLIEQLNVQQDSHS